MATPSKTPVYRVAVLVFPGADILDFAGPIECLTCASYSSNSSDHDPVFSIETICRTKDAPISTGHGNMFIQPTMSTAETLEALDTFHVLIVAGGAPEIVLKMAKTEDGQEMKLIRHFARLCSSEKPDEPERILMSICTGAMLLGAAGVLKGVKATTHHLALELLQKICDESANGDKAEEKTEVVGGRRVVDAGKKEGMRILTAGGISSGLDASLYLVELMTDRGIADSSAELMEYTRQD